VKRFSRGGGKESSLRARGAGGGAPLRGGRLDQKVITKPGNFERSENLKPVKEKVLEELENKGTSDLEGARI